MYLTDTSQGLNPKALTMAEVFKANGYQTALVGKWHLGDRPPLRPHRQGFDQTFYINKSNNQTDELWRGDKLVEKPFVNRRLTETFAREAIQFIPWHAHGFSFLTMATLGQASLLWKSASELSHCV